MPDDFGPVPKPRYDRGGYGGGKRTAVMAPKPPEPSARRMSYEKPGGRLLFWLLVFGLAAYLYFGL